jgi:hypothetical protein
MSEHTSPQIDFDEWADLAKRDPEAFERRRAQVIEEFLDQVPDDRRERLRCLQWRIDRTRERASNPVAACVRLSQMMWDSVLGDGGLLEALEGARVPCAKPAPRRSARVLHLKPRSRA